MGVQAYNSLLKLKLSREVFILLELSSFFEFFSAILESNLQKKKKKKLFSNWPI